MSRRGSDARARDRRHRAAVAQRAESVESAESTLPLSAPTAATRVPSSTTAAPARLFGRPTGTRRPQPRRTRQSIDPAELDQLRGLVTASEAASRAVEKEVQRLRRSGANWPTIASALNVSRQAARQRYAPRG